MYLSHSQRGQAYTRRNRFIVGMGRRWYLAFGGSFLDPPPTTELDFLGDLHKWLVAGGRLVVRVVAGEIPYIRVERIDLRVIDNEMKRKIVLVGSGFCFRFLWYDNSWRWWRSIFRLLGRDTQTQSVASSEKEESGLIYNFSFNWWWCCWPRLEIHFNACCSPLLGAMDP